MQNSVTVCSKVLLDDSEPGNRKVVCKYAIKEGELLLEENFQMVAMYSPNSHRTCHYCLKEVEDAKRCSVCKYAHYCCKDHQTLDWSRGHKKECAIIGEMTHQGKRHPTAPLMLTLKAFVQIDLLRNREFSASLESLKSHEDKMTTERYDELKGNIVLIIKYTDHNFDLERMNAYVRLQDKMLLNGVTIYSKNDPTNSLAMALLKDFSRFNHSCEPNCFSVFNAGRGNRMVAARDIQPGEELVFSYVNTLDRPDVRKKKLSEDYYFECSCPKCVREEKLEKIKKSPVLSKEQLRKPLETLDEISTYLKDLQKSLSEYDYEWYDALENIEPALIKINELQYLYNLRKTYTKKFEYWFKGIMMNPLVGQHYSNLAKLANFLGKPQKTCHFATEALQICRRYYPPSDIGQLEEMLVDAQACLQLRQQSSLK